MSDQVERFFDRLLAIESRLKKNRWVAANLADDLHVSDRTVKADIRFLKKIGAPIESDHTGHVLIDQTWSISNFTVAELLGLMKD